MYLVNKIDPFVDCMDEMVLALLVMTNKMKESAFQIQTMQTTTKMFMVDGIHYYKLSLIALYTSASMFCSTF